LLSGDYPDFSHSEGSFIHVNIGDHPSD